ncbi:hypothetical protein N7509_004209 [Penicillium cosmopolitanum]|uniref:Major facilitator superfamily (MFS) profile domain-containing protein n=1 Tax=Penicillium cosmopolitanum TaxID=1131564 RepID=A0A9X0BC74_9EURO|nr:uncharacterized protein N7509_004209 [Penicillium cosmopolitanum]KAJ5404338.1 hypothetical protein N7509_004209 [Penicillium cosmopolitanum]
MVVSPIVEDAEPLLLDAGDDIYSLEEFPQNSVGLGDSDFPEYQLEWSESFKWGVVALLSFMGFTVSFTCISIAPVASYIVEDLDGSAGTKSAVLLVTIWELGEAVGPLFIAPLSEVFGRYPLLITLNLVFVMATIFAALSPSSILLIVSRALMGMSTASNVLSPAIIGDIFEPEQRGSAISLITFIPLIGSNLGSAVSGIIMEKLGWRAIIWISVVLTSICQLLLVTFFRETYKVSILKGREARLGSEKKRIHRVVLADLLGCIMRPAMVLLSSGVLAALALFGSIIFAHLYVVATTLPVILKDTYGLSATATGLSFLANGLGSVMSFAILIPFLDKIYMKLGAGKRGGLPEHRLPLSIIGALTLPPAVLLYGWCAEYRLPLPLLLFSATWIRLSMMLAFSPLTSYVVDAFGVYSASALAGLVTFRCLAGAFLPLTITQITENFGYGWGFTLLGVFGMGLALIPVLVIRYGYHWRQRSSYTENK